MMTNIKALCEESAVLNIHDGGTYSEHCDLKMNIWDLFVFMLSW